MINLSEVYQLIQKIETGDLLSSAFARQKASDILATKTIDLKIRQTLADQLNQLNLQLALHKAVADDSY
ncbi:hypothetical protein VB715_07470 [Crocosphaera sp. UHCC 0190]|uniref:hypothetical protein n=1 Tax=Crocosphaera sp. UHCC 0190 TaxID=3110246 RepID=UPI002B219FB1|nr:hypothetical protein [Crocosphaera sp. UHCC 0190]MEA5509599.1 hypothetical protein [Crocosphaera sp. UHCC 0190]